MFNEEGNHIDELFRSAIKGHQETPPASAWDNIVEKRSFGHILLNQISLNWKNFLFLTFIFATAGISIIVATDGNKSQSARAIIDNQTHQINENRGYNSDMLLAYNEPNGGSIQGLRKAGNNTTHIKSSTYEAVIHSNNTFTNQSFTNKEASSLKATETPLLNDKTNKQRDQISQNNQPSYQLPNSKQIKEIDREQKKIKRENRINNSIQPNSVFEEDFSLLRSISSSNRSVSTTTLDLDQLNNRIDLLNSKGISSLTTFEDRALILDSNYYKSLEKKTLTFKNHLFISIKSGPEFHQTIYNNKNVEFSNYSDKRNNTTSSKVGGSIQMTMSYYLFNNVFFETGFRYNQLREQVNFDSYTILSEKTVFDSTLLGYKVGPTGEPVAIYDIKERIEVEKDITKNSSVNVYHALSIPILVGYQMDFNRFSIQLKTGASTTFLSKREGTIVSTHENETTTLGSSSDPYKNGLIWNWEIATGFGYQLNENINLIVEPTYRATLNSVTKSDAALSEKYKTFGFLTGIRIKL